MTPKKMSMSKTDFNQAAQGILAASKANAQSLAVLKDAGLYEQQNRRIEEHDPELARLLREADFASLEPLNRIVRYLSARTEN